MREFLEFVIRQLIEYPDDMVLTEIPSGRTTVFKLQLRRGDVGRVIGRGGQTIQAIRALLASCAARHGDGVSLEIIEQIFASDSRLDVRRFLRMRIDIVTLFPEICREPLNESMMKRAQ